MPVTYTGQEARQCVCPHLLPIVEHLESVHQQVLRVEMDNYKAPEFTVVMDGKLPLEAIRASGLPSGVEIVRTYVVCQNCFVSIRGTRRRSRQGL